MDFIILVISILSVIVGLVMIFAYITTKNTIIHIISSFETQNSNSYEIRINIFNKAISYLFNITSSNISEDTKKQELGEIFDKLLICATRQDTLKTFEQVVEIYFTEGILDEKSFIKFKACVRKEFGAKKYDSKVVYKYAIPTDKAVNKTKSTNNGNPIQTNKTIEVKEEKEVKQPETRVDNIKSLLTNVTIIPAKNMENNNENK